MKYFLDWHYKGTDYSDTAKNKKDLDHKLKFILCCHSKVTIIPDNKEITCEYKWIRPDVVNPAHKAG